MLQCKNILLIENFNSRFLSKITEEVGTGDRVCNLTHFISCLNSYLHLVCFLADDTFLVLPKWAV